MFLFPLYTSQNYMSLHPLHIPPRCVLSRQYLRLMQKLKMAKPNPHGSIVPDECCHSNVTWKSMWLLNALARDIVTGALCQLSAPAVYWPFQEHQVLTIYFCPVWWPLNCLHDLSFLSCSPPLWILLEKNVNGSLDRTGFRERNNKRWRLFFPQLKRQADIVFTHAQCNASLCQTSFFLRQRTNTRSP